MVANRNIPDIFDHRRLAASLRTLQAAKSNEALNPTLHELCARYGLSHMTLLVVRSGGRADRYPYYCTTYPDAWLKTYAHNRYFEIDPVIGVMRWALLPVDWSSLDRQSAQVWRLFKEARSYNIGPHGLTIPVRGPKGERSLFSAASNLPKRDWSRLLASSMHELHILAHHIHETVLAVRGLRQDDGYRVLSRREYQCLDLLAKGRIHKQIAADLGISETAVKLYLRSARLKLGASTSHHAVAKASLLELIAL